MVKIQNAIETSLNFKRLSGTDSSKNSVRVIVFAVFDYLFAISVGAVNKIIPCPPLHLKFEDGTTTIDLERETITIVDLRHKFIQEEFESIEVSTSNNSFLILIQTITGESCGIFTEKPPLIIEIPLQNIRPVPSSYREIGKLTFVSHMAILSAAESNEPTKIFLLGMNQIIARKLGISLPETSLLVTETREIEPQQRFLPVILGDGKALLPLDSVCGKMPVAIEDIYPTPALPRWVLGIYNWNGHMLRSIDLNSLMGYPPLFADPSKIATPITIVVEFQNQFLGCLVADIYDLETYQLDRMESIEDRDLPKQMKKFVKGAFGDRRWMLDLEQLFKTVRSLNNHPAG